MARIEFKDPHWIFRCTFDERDLPKSLGFYWDSDCKVWSTTSLTKVSRGEKYLTPEARIKFESLSGSRSFPVVSPQDPRLYGYQIAGAEFIQGLSGTMIADEPGLGKTAQAIAAVRAARKGFDYLTVIVCPPFLALNWRNEISFWDPVSFVHILKGRNDFPDLDCDYIIIPDSLLTKNNSGIFAHLNCEWLIVDEAHRFKTPTTQRTQLLFGTFNKRNLAKDGISSRAKRVVLLTGTPLPSRPIELWPLLTSIAPAAIDHMTYYQYAAHYCAGYESDHGYDVSGASNTDELYNRLNKIMIRRLKTDVLKDLPSRTKTSLVILPNKKELAALAYEKNLQAKPKASDYIGEVKSYSYEETQNLVLGAFARERSELAMLKAEHAIDWAKNFLEGNENEKILIFGWHTEAIEHIATGLSDFGSTTITGQTSMERRHDRVHRFQNEPNLRVMVANIQAGGVGLTLTSSSTVLFSEFSWVPSENDQAIDRTHRIGQSKPVTAHFLVYKNSLDEYVFEAQKNKQKVINKILGG